FRRDAALILAAFPDLLDWLQHKPSRVIAHAGHWPNLLRVGQHFCAHPRPDCYIRELPLPISTKFIEQQQTILRELLEQVLPADAIDLTAKKFTARFGLRDKEPWIRLRLLDAALRDQYRLPCDALAIPLSHLARLDWQPPRVIITENEVTFLTLPMLAGSIGVWGEGFQASVLADVPWLAECHLLYWGDIDAHGFQILSQLRAAFPHTKAIMMDQATFKEFEALTGKGESLTTAPPHLTADETKLFQYVATHRLRLEQEHISHAYAVNQLQSALDNQLL
ncbi:MAG: DUF2399 domain-containing protein, partial [Okeania sp. SIO3B3]|nr:DUF2399 domain-containing protein [Okeania sp. SIO3B3]